MNTVAADPHIQVPDSVLTGIWMVWKIQTVLGFNVVQFFSDMNGGMESRMKTVS